MTELDEFITRFGGITEEYTFYNGTVTLRYDKVDHVYLLVTPEGTLEPQDGVTSVAHIIDKSKILVPWGCKVMAEKLHGFVDPVFGQFDAAMFEQRDLNGWIEKSKSAHKDKLDEAGEIGHQAHGFIEAWIKSKLDGTGNSDYIIIPEYTDARVKSCCNAASDWINRHNVRFISTERKVYSRKHRYAGTMDGLARVDSCNNTNCCPVEFKDRLTILDWKTSRFLYTEFILQTAAYKEAFEEETGEPVNDIWLIRLGKEDAEFETWHLTNELIWFGLDAFLNALMLSRCIKTLEALVDDLKDTRKAAKKAEKAAEKEVNLKIKCKRADKYKGVRKPVCNQGSPCETCLKKYHDRLEALKSVGIKPEIYECVNELSENMLKSLQNLLDNPE